MPVFVSVVTTWKRGVIKIKIDQENALFQTLDPDLLSHFGCSIDAKRPGPS